MLLSRKLRAKLDTLRAAGIFSPSDSAERGMRLAIGSAGSEEWIKLYLIVDPQDGMIVDARFQAYGPILLLAAAEVGAEIVIGKNYDQAMRLTAELIDRAARDKGETPAFPKEGAGALNCVLDAILAAGEQCRDIPLPKSYEAPPAARFEESGEYTQVADWEELADSAKIIIIEEVLEKEVRPYIALDAGGVEIINIAGDTLTIAYQGSCTSCISSVGATLSYIQETLKRKVHPNLKVTPLL